MTQKISIFGDGGWGTTLAILLSKKGAQITLWSAFGAHAEELKRTRENKKFLPGVSIPDNIRITADVKEAADASRIVVLAVPSKYMREVVEKLAVFDVKKTIVVSVSKGIEEETHMLMSEVIGDILCDVKLAVLSGPTIAYEVARELPTAAVAASADEAVASEVQKVFMTERFRVYTSDDIVGVELGGALKNVVAIAAGICDGLGFGANSKAGLVARGLVEMKRLGAAMGADERTFNGLSGLGDLVTTCISTHGRNLWAGTEIAKGKSVEEIERETPMVAEGLRTCIAAKKLAKKYEVEMPITSQVYSVLYENKDPRQAVSELMTRERRAE